MKQRKYSVMIWGAIWSNGQSEPLECDGDIISGICISILHNGVFPIIKGELIKETFFMEEDFLLAELREPNIDWKLLAKILYRMVKISTQFACTNKRNEHIHT